MLSDASRIGLIMELLFRTLKPWLENEYARRELDPYTDLARYEIRRGERATFDTARTCLLIRRAPVGFDRCDWFENPEAANVAASVIYDNRNRWAHQEHLTPDQVQETARHSALLLALIGHQQHQDQVEQIVREDPPELSKLREILTSIARSRNRDPISYSELLKRFKLEDTHSNREWTYRLLTALALDQKNRGEPLLCSLVVLGRDDVLSDKDKVPGIPGWGYYWLINLTGTEPLSTRRQAHAGELDRVFRYNW